MQIRSKQQTIIGLFIFLTIIQKSSTDLFEIEDVSVHYTPSGNQIEFNVNNPEYVITNVTCTKSRFPQIEITGINICEKLDACSTYNAKLLIENINNGSIVEKNIVANTTYLLPKIEITSIEPTKNSIYVAWNATNVDCISNYQISAKSEDKHYESTLEKTEVNINITNLSPCQTNLIELKTYDVNDKTLISHLTNTTETIYDDPGPVNSISFTPILNDKNDSVLVKWDFPEQRSCIQYYHLQWTNLDCFGENGNDENCEWNYRNLTDPYVKEYSIDNLKGCDEYGFIIAINAEQIENLKLNNFTSPEQVPGVVTNLQPISKHESVNIIWSPPIKNYKCVNYYQIFLSGPLQNDIDEQINRNKTTDNTNVEFDLLFPCGKYNISVQAISEFEFRGAQQNITFNTLENNPTKIQNVRTEIKPREITLYWDPPNYAALCIKHYRIVSWNPNEPLKPAGNFNNLTNDTFIKIENLVSCQKYDFQVIAVTHLEKDGLPEHIHTETAAIIPSTPKSPQPTMTSHNKLQLDTQDLDQNNNCQILYAKFVCKFSGNAIYKTAESIVAGDIKDFLFKATLEPLSPETKYVCEVSLFNVAGWSNVSKAVLKTGPYYPEIPQNIEINSVTNSSISYAWKEPRYANGQLNLYHIYFKRVGPAYEMPSSCEIETEAGISAFVPNTDRKKRFDNVKAYTTYSFQIAVENNFGRGPYSEPIIVTTMPWISDPVEEFNCSTEGPDPNAPAYKSNVTLTWQSPCHINGEILQYQLYFVGQRTSYETHEYWRKVPPTDDTDGFVTYTEENLRPEYNYNVSLYVENKYVLQMSQPKKINFIAPAGIPTSINVEGLATVNVFESKNPTTSALVRFPTSLLNFENGDILYAALLVSESDCQPDPIMQWDKIDSQSQWPKTLTWGAVQTHDCIKQYQTTPVKWSPRPLNAKSIDSSSMIEYTIGNEDCTLYPKMQYCNGPLKADTKYKLIVRLFTRSGYNDTGYLVFKTDAMLNIFVIVLSVVSCLILAFIIGFLYLYITKRLSWHWRSQDLQDPTGNIAAKDFYLYYFVISKMEKIQREYKELQVVANDFSITASSSNENKNRYCNIFPYDKNRVILDIDSEGSDYINASFINGYRKKKEYIATQGPKPESFIDFWRMILQNNVRVIVMVTQFKEGDIIKCHPYFPTTLGKELKFGNNIIVTCRKELFEDIFEKRELTITHAGEEITRTVIHYYFKKWPDHDCPKDPIDLIAFVKKVKSEKKSSHSPIVVHCSAGVGRTGTFIGLDIIMQRLKSEGIINVYETVKDLRFQRMKMVQSIQQYTFLYRCTYELLNKKYNARSKFKLNLNNDKKKVSFKEEEEEEDENIENTIDILSLGCRSDKRNSNASKSDTISNASSDNHSFRPNNIESFM